MNNQTFIEKKIILEFSFCMSLYSFIFLNESMPSYKKKKKKKKSKYSFSKRHQEKCLLFIFYNFYIISLIFFLL